MGLGAISSLNSCSLNSLYAQNGSSNKFALKSSGVAKEIQELEEKLKSGQISEQEFEAQKKQLESLPQILYTSDGNNNLTVGNASLLKTNSNTEEIDKIEQQHAKGEISDFSYKANMYLLTNQPPDNNTVGKNLSYYA